MNAKTITISLAGRTENCATKPDQLQCRYEDYFLAVDLKSGQPLGEQYEERLLLSDISVLLSLSESRLGVQAAINTHQLPNDILTEWLIKVARRLPPPERLIRALEEVNYRIWCGYGDDIDLNEQLLTASLGAIIVEENIAYVAQVGDVGAFIVRQGRIRRLPNNYPAVRIISADDELSEEDNQEVVMPIELGAEKLIYTGVTAIELQPNDCLLLCTDELLNFLKLSDMLQLIVRNVAVASACQQIVTAARKHGSEGQLGIVLAQFSGEGLVIQPGATRLTNCFQFFSRTEQTNVEKSPTRPLTMISTQEMKAASRDDDENEEELYPSTIGIGGGDKDLSSYEYCQEILSGFTTCQTKLTETETHLQTQLNDLKKAIDWLQSQNVIDGKLFDSFVKIELAMKKTAEAAALVTEAHKNLPYTKVTNEK
ncbi:MAG: hypothetical protein AB1489_33585 [Acidobacteriota bacterium]